MALESGRVLTSEVGHVADGPAEAVVHGGGRGLHAARALQRRRLPQLAARLARQLQRRPVREQQVALHTHNITSSDLHTMIPHP